MKIHNDFKFRVGSYEGGFLAVSKVEPIFCIFGSTEKEAIEKALRAWGFYLSAALSKAVTPHVKSHDKAQSNRFSIKPRGIITAEAC